MDENCAPETAPQQQAPGSETKKRQSSGQATRATKFRAVASRVNCGPTKARKPLAARPAPGSNTKPATKAKRKATPADAERRAKKTRAVRAVRQEIADTRAELEATMAPLRAELQAMRQLEQAHERLQGEFAALQTAHAELEAAHAGCAATAARADAAEADVAAARASLAALEAANAELTAKAEQLEGVRGELEAALAQLEEARQGNAALEAANAELSGKAARFDATAAELAAARESNAALEAANAELSGKAARFDATAAELAAERGVTAQLQGDCDELRALVEELEEQRRVSEALRRRLHEEVQQLKGNIRVFCRVRPLLAGEAGGAVSFAANAEDARARGEPEALTLTGAPKASVDGRSSQQKSWGFSFDRVFAPEASQADVFGELSQLVQSALDGYSVCVFAYGPTGSGKTYTMEGSPDSGDEAVGMIPRSVAQVFREAGAMEALGWAAEMHASVLQIYNEQVFDLQRSTKRPLEIKQARDGSVSCPALSVTPVASADEVHALLARASQARAVAATGCNERSSRSHCVFQLKVALRNAETGEQREGLLCMIDLAGSERVKESGATGERLKETQNINRSLSALGDVIFALGNRDAHVPYRNSALTRLLQTPLAGDAKVLMMVNASPAADSLGETLCSLRFARKVNACDVGTASRRSVVS